MKPNSCESNMAPKLTLTLVLLVAVVAYLIKVYPDFIVVCLPKYVDAYFVRALYPRNRTNTGTTSLPTVTKIIPTPNSDHIVADCLASPGNLVLVKNFLTINETTDRDIMMEKLRKANAGKELRLLNFEHWKIPHFSPSCSEGNIKTTSMPFDSYAEKFMLGDAAKNNTYLYAGFESITGAGDLEDVTGYDWRKEIADYKHNNLFISNFPKNIVTAPLHGAPVDSFSIQLLGTKVWYFVPPDELASVPNIPMPTAFNLPMTDDELLSKLKNVIVVKQEPGDLVYFGPHWAHVVETYAGPNLMFNVRVDAKKKLRKGPPSFLFKALIRINTRKLAAIPQENNQIYPMLYSDINSYYPNCGKSEGFEKILDHIRQSEQIVD